ncbi:glycoside hydrolase family 28 protein [Bacteroides sp. 224]|uniref:glycoside hydrolase family 28 protein n=1 Tax=Bacteroides sp. 224 TaxID=2302936 RepID=UPI0013D130B2|nr:glycoside hydrolase family 28 protein [Bacteroides sp. 224]NDV67102.1 glycoside hydrolase family 28 protein [Bacteroides sp. 224]
MKLQRILLFICSFTFLFSACKQKESYPYEYLYKNLPFEMPRVKAPVFPENKVNLKDFGAISNGMELCTNAFAQAIASLEEKGGGKLIVPTGVWLTGPIFLKSNINLHLEKGALILFSPDVDLYPLVETIFEGLDTRRCQSPISGRNLVNVAITGEGAIDGNGHFWRPLKREKVTDSEWKQTIARGGVFKRPTYWFPYPETLKGDSISDMNVPRNLKTEEEWQSVRHFLRPVMVSLIECKNVWLEGVIFQNSPAWNVHPLMCENVLIENVQVRNPSYSQNGDGLDLESCVNSLIVNSTFDVGDDGICIKSGKDEDGRKRARPCENVIIDGCTVFKGHGGFVVGSEMSGGVRNISVSNCNFLGTDVGLRFKSKRGRGGVVENIWIRNISMMDIPTEPVTFNLYYGGKSAVEVLESGEKIPAVVEPMPVDETTPAFRNIHIENLVCAGARRALFFNGIPEMPIDGIKLKNIDITSQLGAEFIYSKDITMENVNIRNKEGEKMQIHHCENVTVN